MHGAAFALAFFFGAGLLVRFGSFVGAACNFMFVKTFVTTTTFALLEVSAWDFGHLFP